MSEPTGIALRDTTPAGIEKYLVEKVRNELGAYHDLVTIQPYLRIDQEDGDLSGNIKNGYGTVMVKVGGQTIHLPFIINDKELLPFDTIRMKDQEVSYDLSKLRKLAIALDKKEKERSVDGADDVMDVVDIKDVSTHNGFLGTIMNIRDSHKNSDVNGVSPYDGASFGEMDDIRLNKTASEEVDLAESFETFNERLASVKTYSRDDVKEVVRKLSKQAETERTEELGSETDAPLTKEAVEVERMVAQLKNTRLADHKNVRSGNNVVYPSRMDGQFEFKTGRVYHEVAPFSPIRYGAASKLKHLVVDVKGGYALLKDSDKFMVNVESPEAVKFPSLKGASLRQTGLYSFEYNQQKVALPFLVKGDYLNDVERNGMVVSVRERISLEHNDNKGVIRAHHSSLFKNSYRCEETTGREFELIVKKNGGNSIETLSSTEVNEYILQNSANDLDRIASQQIIRGTQHSEKVLVVGEEFNFFELTHRITGFFTRPDGLFNEGPLFQKQAAYENNNKVRLRVNGQSRPTSYSVEWMVSEKDGEGLDKLSKKSVDSLSEVQAKDVLADLGFDHRKQELFFQIAKQNGRYAEFALPNADKAVNITPEDRSESKAKQAVKNIASSTLNAGNFTPVMEDIMVDASSGFIRNALPDVAGWAVGLKDKLAQSHSTAVEFEKIASSFSGEAWSEVAMLMNMKYRMDKLAEEITEGFVKDAEPVFKEVMTLESKIEKTASALIEFNRDQRLRVNAPLVNPMLVKEALTQLDEFSSYVEAGKAMEKRAFFNQGTRKELKRVGEQLSSLQDLNKLDINRIKNHTIDMRVLNRKGQLGTEAAKEKNEKLKSLTKQFNERTEQIGSLAKEQESLAKKEKRNNRLGFAAVGIPTIGTFGYKTQENKDSRK